MRSSVTFRVDALSKRVSPKQIPNMNDSGVTARRFKGNKGKVISLASYKTEMRFHDPWDVTNLPVAATLSPGSSSFLPLFLTVSDAKLKHAGLFQLQDQIHTSRTPRGRMTTLTMVFSMQHIIIRSIGFSRTGFSDQELKIYLIPGSHSDSNSLEVLPLHGK
jgi:hypothetical protein